MSAHTAQAELERRLRVVGLALLRLEEILPRSERDRWEFLMRGFGHLERRLVRRPRRDRRAA